MKMTFMEALMVPLLEMRYDSFPTGMNFRYVS